MKNVLRNFWDRKIPIFLCFITLSTIAILSYRLVDMSTELEDRENIIRKLEKRIFEIEDENNDELEVEAPTDDISETVDIPKILKSKDVCGTIEFEKNIKPTYNLALESYVSTVEEKYTRSCPNNPCYDIEVNAEKAEQITDLEGNILELELYILHIIDRATGLHVESVSNAIDSFGNFYDIYWCED